MKHFFLAIALILNAPSLLSAVDLVVKGQPVAEIVITAEAGSSLVLAAQELQRHLEKISGATLPIVTNLTANVATKVYVGESEHTRKLGITLDDVKYDGFKVVAKDNWVVLAGREFSVAPTMGQYAYLNTPQQRKIWEEATGKKWRTPAILSSYGGLCEGVYADDGTGSLYAVYDLLEQLGMRWYLPMADLGIVYPALKDVRIATQNLKREPQFPVRQFINRSTRFDDWYWYKSMKMGNSLIFPQTHTVEYVMAAGTNNLPADCYATVGGKYDVRTPRLSSENLRRETAEYLEAMIAAHPGLQYLPISMPDGWLAMDDEDAVKWKRADSWGEFSDYSWDFIMDVRARVKAKHPDKTFSTFAYSLHKLPPNQVDTIPEDISISFCQNSTLWMLPGFRRDLQVREDWLKRVGNNRMIVYDYYFDHAPPRRFPPIPVIFTKYMEENFRGMYGRVLGFWVDTAWVSGDSLEESKNTRTFLRRPGLGHLMFYLHNRLAWDAKLDLDAVLNEYYDLFFGPASKEMKAFYEFAEEVWARPLARQISAGGGFLKPTDVERYFEILNRAKARAGDSIYGRRVELIAAEMAPLATLFDELQRSGPDLTIPVTTDEPLIDGDLDKPFWHGRDRDAQVMREMFVGETPHHVKTSVSFRWLEDDSAIIVGVECFEPTMDGLKESCKDRDTMSIYEDDTVEIRFETSTGIRPLLVVTSRGTINDECITENPFDLPQFYKVDQVAVRKYPDRWTVEARIETKPISGVRPTKTAPWGVNVCRQRMAGNKPEYYMLSPSGTYFFDITSMGNLSVAGE